MKLFLVTLLCLMSSVSTSGEDLLYFTKLCHDFSALESGQFAVITFGKLQQYVPFPLTKEVAKQKGNYLYAMAKLTPPREHSEVQILKHFEEALKRFKDKRPDIYLFSLNSPCKTCAGKIRDYFTQFSSIINSFKVGWHFSYIPQSETTRKDKNGMEQAKLDFQSSLETLLTAGIEITWDSRGVCPTKPSQGLSFQQSLFNCLLTPGKLPNFKKFKKCTSLNHFKADLAKVVNKLVWKCTGFKKSVDPVCYCDGLKELKIQAPKKCAGIGGGFLQCMPAFNVMLGPPIDPTSANIPNDISSSLEDLKGNYGSYCMQS